MNRKVALISVQEFLRDGYYAAFFMLLPFIAADLNISFSQIGSLQSIASAIALVIALPAGILASKYGAMKVLSFALLLYGLAFLALPVVTSYWPLFLLCIIAGFGFSIYSTLISGVLAAITSKKTRGQSLGIVMAIGDVGKMCLSMLVPVLLIYISWQVTGLLFGGIAMGVFFVSYIFLKEPEDQVKKVVRLGQGVTLKDLLQNRQYVQSVLASAIDALASHPLFVLLPALLISKNFEAVSVGALTGTYYFGNIISRIVFGKLVDIFGSGKIFIFCEVLMAVFILALVFSSSFIVIGTACILLGLVSEGTDPAVQSMTAESIEHMGEHAQAFSLRSLANNIARTSSPIILGVVADNFGLSAAFYVIAVVIVIASLPAIGFLRKSREASLLLGKT